MTLDLTQVYEEERSFLRGYCYRLTGDSSAAEDMVQEAFVRTLAKPPADTSRSLRPWLVRVATNIFRDQARRNRRVSYVGPWLPSPLPTPEEAPMAKTPEEASARYELRESASIAFLLALEALTPDQRSVLLLRDVYDYSVKETAELLGATEGTVRTRLHRARKALEDYDGERIPLDSARIRRTSQVLEELLKRLFARDLGGVEALLAANVRSLSDSNGRFFAAKVPVAGASKVALMYTKLTPPNRETLDLRWTNLNYMPAVVLSLPEAPEGHARWVVFSIDLDRDGRIARAYAVMAPQKLASLIDSGVLGGSG